MIESVLINEFQDSSETSYVIDQKVKIPIETKTAGLTCR